MAGFGIIARTKPVDAVIGELFETFQSGFGLGGGGLSAQQQRLHGTDVQRLCGPIGVRFVGCRRRGGQRSGGYGEGGCLMLLLVVAVSEQHVVDDFRRCRPFEQAQRGRGAGGLWQVLGRRR